MLIYLRKMLLIIAFVFLFPLTTCQAEGNKENIFSQHAIYYYQEGQKFYSQGKLYQALSAYRKAISINPLYPDAYNDMGIVYEELGQREKAKDSYRKAIEIDKNYLPAYTNLALIFEEEDDYGMAIYYWRRRLELSSSYDDYWNKVAAEHLLKLAGEDTLKKNKELEVGRLVQKIIKDRKENKEQINREASGYYLVAKKLFLQGRYEEAMARIKKARDLRVGDKDLSQQIDNLYGKIKFHIQKQKALFRAESAIRYLKSENLTEAKKQLQAAESLLSRLSNEK